MSFNPEERKKRLNEYMALGIGIGLMFGAAVSVALGNFAFIGLGLPIGLAIGIALAQRE